MTRVNLLKRPHGLLVAVAVVTAAGPASVPAAQRDTPRLDLPGPPEVMIDFLGRRRECAGLAASPGETAAPPSPGSWREWLRCDQIPREEAELRGRFAADASALAYLDRPPEEYEPENVQVHSYHGPPRGNVTHIELSGTDHSGRVRWRLAADSKADDGRATSLSVSWGTHPTRTILIDNRRVPWLDVGSVWVALGIEPGLDQLNLEMRFGFARGWCGDIDHDDRPRLSVTFKGDGTSVFRQDKTNCRGGYEEMRADTGETPVFR